MRRERHALALPEAKVEEIHRLYAGDMPINKIAEVVGCSPRTVRNYTQKKATPLERRTYTVEEAGQLLGISRGTAYALARDGRLPIIRISRRRWIVSRAQLERLLNGEVNHEK